MSELKFLSSLRLPFNVKLDVQLLYIIYDVNVLFLFILLRSVYLNIILISNFTTIIEFGYKTSYNCPDNKLKITLQIKYEKNLKKYRNLFNFLELYL